jgi:hypothetical protein
MAYKKKISDAQFLLDIIQKELDIVEAGVHFENIGELNAWGKEHPTWYKDYEFKTLEQFYEWREYFYEHFYDWQPKRTKKSAMKEYFRWYNLQYGLKYGFDYRLIKYD